MAIEKVSTLIVSLSFKKVMGVGVGAVGAYSTDQEGHLAWGVGVCSGEGAY